MAKARPYRKEKSYRGRHREQLSKAAGATQPQDPPLLLVQAAELLHTGQPELALRPAEQALSLLSESNGPSTAALPALSLLGEIQIELGDAPAAFKSFESAAAVDPDGSVPEEHGGGPEKFMWLAQLCEAGGRDSIRWFQKGVTVLERDISTLQNGQPNDEELIELRGKLAGTLSAMAEVWMTDLSLEPEAEQECEDLMRRALEVEQPASAATLQTLASIRLSQSQVEDARKALGESITRWQSLPPEHQEVPDFAMRISLSRLLMESEMYDEALEVLERLVEEDDESVEAWYLGGWCQWLLSLQCEGGDRDGQPPEGAALAIPQYLSNGRDWLRNCLRLYCLQGYEDDGLKKHAAELVQQLDRRLEGVQIEDPDEDWVDENEGDDETDQDAEGSGKSADRGEKMDTT